MTTQIADIEQDDSKTRAQVLAIGAGNGDHIFRTSDTNEWLFLDNNGTVTDLSYILSPAQYAEITKFSSEFTSSDDVPSDIGTILFDASANMDMTLLSVDALKESATFVFKDFGGNAETYTLRILTEGSETIDGNSDFTFTTNGEAVTIRSHGGNWEIISDAKTSSSPLTTKGDLVAYDTAPNRLPVGSNGQILTADSAEALGVKWSSAGTGLDATSIQSIPVLDTMPADGLGNDYQLTNKWYQNLLKWSEDLTQSIWLKSAITIDGTDGLIPSASLTTQRVFQSSSWVIGQGYTYSVDATAENTGQWISIVTPQSSPGGYSYFDVKNGILGSKAANADNHAISDIGNGKYRCSIDFTADTTSQSARIHVVTGDGATSGQGDGVTVHNRISGVHAYKGTIADNFPYIETTTTAETGKREYTPEPKVGSNKLLNIATGVWEVPQYSTKTVWHKYISPVQGDPRGQVRTMYFDSSHGMVNFDELFPILCVVSDFCVAVDVADEYCSPMFSGVAYCKFRKNVVNDNLEFGIAGFTMQSAQVNFIEL